jgi:hypothetical protein
MKTKVCIIESEAGWGQRVDEIKEFDTLELAQEFCKKFNEYNNQKNVPYWYMYAEII